MNIASFDDLLRAARSQSEPQRLLFAFANRCCDRVYPNHTIRGARWRLR